MILSSSMRATVLTAFAFFLGCSAARAGDPLAQGPGFYVGGTLGAVGVTPNDLKTTSKQDDEGRASSGAFVGLRLATIPVAGGWPLYLELAYQDIARLTLRYKVDGSTSDLTAQGHAVSLAARLGFPLTDRFGLFARLGASHAKVEGSTPAGQPVIQVNGSSSGVVSGFGVEYQFDSGPVLRGEVTRYAKVSPHAGAAAFTLGMGFKF